MTIHYEGLAGTATPKERKLAADADDLLRASGARPEDASSALADLNVIPERSTYASIDTDTVRYVVSSVTSVPQAMATMSTRTGEAREVYGLNRLSKGSEGATSYYLQDGLGSVVQAKDHQGEVTGWQAYGAFGEPIAGDLLAESPAYGYRAEEYSPASALAYLRARYYAPDTATFGVADDYLGELERPATQNRYAYGLGNPLKHIDPTGHFNLWGAIASFASGVASTVKKVASTVASVAKKAASAVVGAVNAVARWAAGPPSAQGGYRGNAGYAGAGGGSPGWGASGSGGYSGSGGSVPFLDWVASVGQSVQRFSCGAAKSITGFFSNIGDSLSRIDFSDAGHAVLDVVGMVPGVGVVADVANGVWYAAEGNYVDAGMSFLSAIPGVGDTVGLAKMGVKAGKGLASMGATAGKIGKAGPNNPMAKGGGAPQVLGGSYSVVRNSNIGGEVHHIPSVWAIRNSTTFKDLSPADAPAILVTRDVHLGTGSFGRGKEADAFRQKELELLNAGDFKGAQQLSIDALKKEYGDEFSEHIRQFDQYTDSLLEERYS